MQETAPKRVKDPVHDFIELDPYAVDLVDQPAFQRLRRVRQTGTAYLVYPGANHTRFEHSLGAHHLAKTAARALDLDAGTGRTLAAAALLHDLGHGPFSHLSEAVVEAETGRSHEQLSLERVEEAMAPILEEHGIPLDEVRELLVGEHRLSDLISGPLDVDRIDYLLRDGHYTGVATAVDAQRIVHTVDLDGGRVVLTRDGQGAAEAMLATRFAMHQAVYFHHTCRAAELTLQSAVRDLVQRGELGALELAGLDDYQLVERLREDAGRAGAMARRVLDRRLPKVVREIPYRRLDARWRERVVGDREALGRLEAEIAGDAGVPAHHVLVDAPERPTPREVDAPVRTEEGVERLSEVSTIVASLADAHEDHGYLRVYAFEESRGAVAGAAPEELSLERPLDAFL